MKYIISFIALFAVPLCLTGQYVTYDKDGFTNVRNGPGTQYEIVDKVMKYELFYSPEIKDAKSSNWMPFARKSDYEDGEYVSDEVKYIFKANIRSLGDMPLLRSEITRNGKDMLLSCSNSNICINLVLQNFDINNHVLKDVIDNDGWKWVSVDGKLPKGVFNYTRDELKKQKEIKTLYIEQGNKRINLPIDAVKNYYTPWAMSVRLGFEDELYITIAVGDASEAAFVTLTVVDGVIKFVVED